MARAERDDHSCHRRASSRWRWMLVLLASVRASSRMSSTVRTLPVEVAEVVLHGA